MKKKLLILAALSLASLAYAAPVTDTVGVDFIISDSLTINASSTNIDFGDVVVEAGEVQSSQVTLTVSGNDTTSLVSLSVDSMITLSSDTATLKFISDFSGADGTTSDNGNTLVWTANNAFAAPGDEWVVDFGGKFNLLGTEASGEYKGTATITAYYN